MVTKYLLSLVALSLLVSCASIPNQELSDARQAIQIAREAEAEKYAPENLSQAIALLSDSEEAALDGEHESALNKAVQSKQAALSARRLAMVIGAAYRVLAQAEAIQVLWRDSEKLLQKAIQAARDGEIQQAVRLAEQVVEQGEMAINQYYLENVRLKLQAVKSRQAELSDRNKRLIEQVETAYRNHQGQRAYELLQSID